MANEIKFNWIIAADRNIHSAVMRTRHITSIKIPQQTKYGMGIFHCSNPQNSHKMWNVPLNTQATIYQISDNWCAKKPTNLNMIAIQQTNA